LSAEAEAAAAPQPRASEAGPPDTAGTCVDNKYMKNSFYFTSQSQTIVFWELNILYRTKNLQEKLRDDALSIVIYYNLRKMSKNNILYLSPQRAGLAIAAPSLTASSKRTRPILGWLTSWFCGKC
jgi:hypothetical protein